MERLGAPIVCRIGLAISVVAIAVSHACADDTLKRFRSSQESDIWINGGYFIFRSEIFEFMRPGEELVLEPFNRLIEKDLLMAYKHEGFWRAMDTLRDRQVLEEMVERGDMPWRPTIDSWRRSNDPAPVGVAR